MKTKVALGLVALVAGSLLASSSAYAHDNFPGRHNGWQTNRGCGYHQGFNPFRNQRFQQANSFRNQRLARIADRRFDNRWFNANPNRRYW